MNLATVLGTVPLAANSLTTLREPGVFGLHTVSPIGLRDVNLGESMARIIRPGSTIVVETIREIVNIPGPTGAAGPPGTPGIPGPTGAVGSDAPVSSKISDYLISPLENQTTFDNASASGLVILTLPPAVPGLRYAFIVLAPQVLEISANGGDQITIGAQISSLGGTAQSNVPNSYISLIVPEGISNLWVAQSLAGSWQLT